MEIKELIKIRESLNNFVKVLLPRSTDNYKVYKLYKKVEEEIQNYNIQRDKIVMQFGTKKSDGTISILSDNPNYLHCINVIQELGDIEVDITIEKIQIYPDDVRLCAADLYNLNEFGLIEIIETKEGD